MTTTIITTTDEAGVCRNVNGAAYGELLAGQECIIGRYPVTESLLKLVSAFISQVPSVIRVSIVNPMYASRQSRLQ